MTILEKLFQTETKNHGNLLAEYRQLLVSDDDKNANRLIEVAEALRIPLDRLQGDQAAICEAERLQGVAGDLNEAETALQAAYVASDKHRAAMNAKISKLEKTQAELVATMSAASSRAKMVMRAVERLHDLHAEHDELFPDVHAKAAAGERERLQTLADSLPGLRSELADSQTALVEAEEAYEKLANLSWNESPLSEEKTAAIGRKTEAGKRRDEIGARIADLYSEIEKAETAKRELSVER